MDTPNPNHDMETVTIPVPPVELGPEDIPAPSKKIKPPEIEENTQNIDYGAWQKGCLPIRSDKPTFREQPFLV